MIDVSPEMPIIATPHLVVDQFCEETHLHKSCWAEWMPTWVLYCGKILILCWKGNPIPNPSVVPLFWHETLQERLEDVLSARLTRPLQLPVLQTYILVTEGLYLVRFPVPHPCSCYWRVYSCRPFDVRYPAKT